MNCLRKWVRDIYSETGGRLPPERELARLAAIQTPPLQVKRMQALGADIRGAETWAAYDAMDSALHDLIAESAGNVLLHELHKVMNAVRQVVVWRKLSARIEEPMTDYHSFDEHDVIVEAIARRDCTAATVSMHAHV